MASSGLGTFPLLEQKVSSPGRRASIPELIRKLRMLYPEYGHGMQGGRGTVQVLK